MKQISVGILLCSFAAFGQIESVKQLKQASDLSRGKMRQVIQSGANEISKTLYVNPFIGTGGHGHTYPGATAPFGMMQLSPDTRKDGWDGCGGYHYSDSILFGFSHTHLSGTGVSDYADLLITPLSESVPLSTQDLIDGPELYGHTFRHEKEVARPGEYRVHLEASDIKVRLSASTRAGMHNYQFLNPDGQKQVLLDLDYRDQLISADFKIEGKQSLSGHRVSKAWATEQHFYFFIETNVEWENAERIFVDGRHKLLLTFPTVTRNLLIKVGMSAVDAEGAQSNLNKEIPHWSFDFLVKETTQKWEAELNKIDFHSSDRTKKTIFYTAMYHSFLNPNVFYDVDGRYRGMDQNIHQLQGAEEQYTVFSLWDTFRAAHPLFNLVQQDRSAAFVSTLIRQGRQNEDLPVWELAGNETECMIGYHSVSVLSDAAIKNIGTHPSDSILQMMLKTSTDSVFGKDFYTKNHYLSLEKEPESVSKLLEYAYDDYTISEYAKTIGNQIIASDYLKRSFSFINHFDPSTGFYRARRGGQWFAPFDPSEVNFNYTEANAWQYSTFAPHAIGTMIDLLGGPKEFEEHLDRLFHASSETSGRNQADITGLIGQYAHGNEPSHHMAYLYNYVGRPDKAQKYVDQILKEMYQDAPDGLSGNEDCGQMSAWYVFSAMGLYPVCPGTPYYNIGRPNADSVSFTVGQTPFEISCINQTDENMYVQSIELNGEQIDRLYLSHSELAAGGKLIITMGKKTNENLKQFKPAPTLTEVPADFTPLPHFKQDIRVFEQSLSVPIEIPPLSNQSAYNIEYSLDDKTWNKYSQPIKIDQTTKIFIRTKNLKTGTYSAIVSTEFVQASNQLEITINSAYANQYAAGGDQALIDGIKGGDEYRTGDWQGYYANDFDAILKMSEASTQIQIQIGFLEDLKSWIFYPKQIVFETSADGTTWTSHSAINTDMESNDYRSANSNRWAQAIQSDTPFQYVRIKAINAGVCPEWHLGKGNPTWLFIDEIEVTAKND